MVNIYLHAAHSNTVKHDQPNIAEVDGLPGRLKLQIEKPAYRKTLVICLLQVGNHYGADK